MSEEKKNNTNDQNLKIEKLPNSEVEIEGEISSERFKKAHEKALKKLKEGVEAPGFRKGKAPENVVVGQVGEKRILEEAAQECISEEYPKILVENKIEAIGQPQITITKVALGEPLGFKAKTAVMPELTLPSYKDIAKEEMAKTQEKEEVTEKEIEEVVLQVRKNRAGMEAGAEQGVEVPESELPEITDEFVKSLGDFQSVDDFKAKIKENLSVEKGRQAQEKKRAAIMESIISGSEVSLPEIVVEGELQKMLSQLRYDVEKAGLKYEEYLSQMKKSEEELRKEWREGAEKRAKFQLILNKIATEEKIFPGKEEVETQVRQILETNKEADPERAKIYVETYLTNEKVFQFLEGQK